MAEQFKSLFIMDGSYLMAKLHLAAAQQVFDKCYVVNTAVENDQDNPNPANVGKTEFSTVNGDYEIAFVCTNTTGLEQYEYAGGIPECLTEKDDEKFNQMDYYISAWTALSAQWDSKFLSANTSADSNGQTSSETSSNSETSTSATSESYYYNIPSFSKFLNEEDNKDVSITADTSTSTDDSKKDSDNKDNKEDNKEDNKDNKNDNKQNQSGGNSSNKENPFTKMIQDRIKTCKDIRTAFKSNYEKLKNSVISEAIPKYFKTFMGLDSVEITKDSFPQPCWVDKEFKSAANSSKISEKNKIKLLSAADFYKSKPFEEAKKEAFSMKELKTEKDLPKTTKHMMDAFPIAFVVTYKVEFKED